MDNSLLSQLEGLSLCPSEDQLTLRQVEELWAEYYSDSEVSVEILRALRKLASTLSAEEKKTLFYSYPNFFKFSIRVLENIPDLILCRVTLQFLFNAFQGSHIISEVKTLQPVLIHLLAQCPDPKVQDYASSLIFLANKSQGLFVQCDQINALLLTACINYESHFALLAIQDLLQKDFIDVYRASKSSEDKSALLQILSSSSNSLIAAGLHVSLLFKEFSKRIMNANGCSWTPGEVLEVTSLLAVLLEVSSKGKDIQEDRDLLIDALHLLKMVHELRDRQDSPFSPIRKLNDVSPEDRKKFSFGFKRDLIRLIGNLVYENEGNQSIVGSLDGLPLILDCSPIDGKNPFITQWVVFAIRNLTRGHLKNQEIIAEMEKSGKLDRKLLVDSGIILSS